MVIIKCLALMKREQFYNLYAILVEMAKTGVILLPGYCELLNEVPHDEEIVIVKKGE